ncbi:hypothetical protein HY932_00645 [Candidatus Falkowbacteria bacterium]|nr:hypothetical protein [Candidatus Falkowbacteria bacterium]
MKLKKIVPSLVLAAAVASLFLDKKTLKKAEEIKKIASQALAAILCDLDSLKKVTKGQYAKVVKNVVADFKKNKTLSVGAWEIVEKELVAKWSEIDAKLRKIKKTAKK